MLLLAPLALFAAPQPGETPVKFRGQTIYVKGDPIVKYLPAGADGNTPDAELVLSYTNYAGTAVNALRTEQKFEARVLVVGSGAAGGYGSSNANNPGGGGGGGEVKELVNKGYDAATYTMKVGPPGIPATSASAVGSKDGNGGNGAPSIFAIGSTLETKVLGGGGGGGWGSVGNGGLEVATGGGSSGKGNAGAEGALGSGYKGGNAVHNRYPGGGGGAGGPGVDGTDSKSGNGGKGKESDITGELLGYGGGGGGAYAYDEDEEDAYVGFAVEGHGGGDGARRHVKAGSGLFARGGGGGGGARGDNNAVLGGAGGSGVVIIRITKIYVELKWKPIPVSAGGNDGKIFVDENAVVSTNAPTGDLIITYTNTTVDGGLRFFDPNDDKLPPVWAKARVLVVGGGGGGGCMSKRGDGGGAGGGAGGVVTGEGFVFDNSVEYSIKVGAGGQGGKENEGRGDDGKESYIKTNGVGLVDTALGGGGGGAKSAGKDGASGGGGSQGSEKIPEWDYARPGGSGKPGQGCAGGVGNESNVGAGGGGFSSKGEDGRLESGISIAGNGGTGVSNDITGGPEWYAAGGGGAYLDDASLTYKHPGGVGGGDGEGGHIIGGNGAGTPDGVVTKATNGKDGTGSGGGGGISNTGADEKAGKGGDGVVIIRLSAFVVKGVPVPEPNNVTYDGAEHCGVKDSSMSYAYELSGDAVRTNANVYTVTATLKYPSMIWENGGQWPTNLTWKIRQREVPVPRAVTGFVYDGTEKVAYAGEMNGDNCVTSYVEGVKIEYCTLSGYRETHAGGYTFWATLCNDTTSIPNVTNFVWFGTETMEPRDVDWSIASATNAITSLTIDDWQEDTAGKSGQPAAAARFQNATDQIVFTYARSETEPSHPADYNLTEKPTEAGVYWVRAYLCKDSEHNPGDWLETSRTARFCIWRHPSKTLTDYVDFTCDSGSSKLIKVPIREAVNGGGTGNALPGFTYSRVGDPSLIRFVAISNIAESAVAEEDRDNPLARDQLLPYTNVTWTVDGESMVWVMLPANATTTFRMYWHLNPGEAVLPDKLPASGAAPTVSVTGHKLVSTVDEEGRAWVNWWLTKPDIKRYWDLGTLTPDKVNAAHGALFDMGGTSITNIFTKMPDLTPVGFPKADEKGAYTVEFTMFDPERGTTAYPGRHVLFGGSYVFDIEIVDHNPQPIVPGSPLDATCSGRVLLVNDDSDPNETVEGQRYDRIAQDGAEVNPYWEHDTVPSPMEEINLKPGTTHTLHYIEHTPTNAVTNAVWKLTGAYIGNMLFTSETASLSNNWNTLPSVPTASENAQIVLQNLEGARIESQIHTNGIGTVYFDAVNVYAGTDVSAADHRLVVEVSTNESTWGAVWTPVPLTVLYYDGSAVTTNATGKAELDCLDVQNGGQTGSCKCYCAYAKVNERAPARFRIRRVSARGGLAQNDPDGFILIDNVTASWPAKEPRVTSKGRFDETLENKRVLGMEGAFTGGYPAARDSFNATVKLSGGTAEDVSSARLHYRWRYLGKRFDPAPQDGKDVWKVEYLDLSTLSTLGPISGNGKVGDIEYWFDLTAFVPYYKYVDHSGVGFDKCVASEEPPKNAVSCSQYGPYPSQGTNWFVRLREGASPYRGVRALLRRHDTPGAAPQAVDLELVSDNLWRGYFRVREKVAAGWDCRFEAEEPLDFEEGTLKTNHWRAAESPEKMPVSCGLDLNGATNRWSVLPGEKQTGYYMLQIDDKAESLAVVHADYQNFNTWHGARKGPGAFTGTTNDVSGASSQVRDYDEEFAQWKDTVAENPLWNETFTDSTATQDGDYFKRGYNGVPLLTKFASATTLNNWSAGSSEYIPGLYQESRVQPGLSLQMDGRGGYLQFVDAGASPRGLESVKFRARVAQQIGFGDFAYCYSGLGQKDYSFITYAAFDRNSNRDFSGNASLSVVAFYRPNVGCYEARWEQIKASTDFTGPDPRGQRLSLYRWSVNAGNVVTCTPLGSITNNVFDIPRTTASASATYLPIYISVKDCTAEDDTTHIMVGVRRAGLTPTEGYANLRSQNFFSICFKDKDNDDHKRLRAGSYGLLSANCRGVFLKPATTGSVPFPTGVTVGNNTPVPATNHTIDFSTESTDYKDEKAHFSEDPWVSDWTIPGSRMRVFGLTTSDNWGVEALDQTAKLAFYTAPKGTTSWSKDPVKTFDVSGFGAAGRSGTDYEPEIFSLDDCSVRIAAAGGAGDAACDIVIDDISMRQWRGENYGDPGTWTAPDDGYGWRTNFIFSSGWITDHAVKLSAKRTKALSNSAIRSPLMDGKDGRGHGLGMISFEYRNAQENAKLLVDIATNLNAGTAKIDESQWVNYTNIDFSAMLPVARLRGVQTVYFGLRGVSGMMRVRVDPEVIAAVSNVTDRTKFGEVTVTRVFCRDEPELDDESWWGWNLRTTDEPEEAYLPDQTLSANAGLSYALNNSIADGLSAKDRTTIDQHMPFLQTPTFGSDIVGEVSFRARKYDLDPLSQKAEIRVYGASSGQIDDDTKWTEIGHVVVSNDQYTSYRLAVNGSYHAFRLGVTGVPGVKDGSRGPDPTEGRQPVRVLIEEVVVSQAITPLLGFEYVRPFREGLDNDVVVPDILSCDQQPLLGESWSVQAEIKARQLAAEIDFDTPGREPRVIFHWFAGMRPWGYDNWRDRGSSAELMRAADSNMVFRGGFTLAPDAVVEPSAAQTYAVVQYMAEVVYWSVNGKCKTNTLSEGEWKRPEWYDPLDLNRDNEDWHSFSAYNILEGIAPRRVWINEANLYDGMVGGHYPASTNQYIEVAAPMQQTIEGWRLAYVDNNCKTNDLCTFGMNGVSSVKTMNATNEYVFFSVQSPKTRDAKTLNISKGEVDGTWKDFNMNGGELGETLPIGLRLIRPSGIVEQEIVLEGTNSWAGSVWGADYSASNMVRKLNAYATGAGGGERWYEVGNEYPGGRSDSLGVTNFIGAVKEDWSSPMRKTPGRVNVGQIVPENYVIYPNGDLLVVYSSVDANGHVKQIFGTATNSTEAAIGIAEKGGGGTNITYRIDDWWEIKSLMTNGVAVPGWAGRTGKQVFTAGKGESNSVYVIATAQPRADIRELIGPDNAYEDAILDWLGKGRTMKGEFENPGEIQLGEYWPKIDDPKYRGRRKLDLTEEYWLDIDPTSSNWVLHAGFCNPMPHEVPMEDASRPNAIRMGIYMAITNVNPESEKFGQNWSPYMLRGLKPGETSQDYSPTNPNAWTSVTFKITGDIQNGMPLRKRWMPLRWFTFDAGSFNPDHTTVIDILNPYDKASPAASYGWRDYIGTQVFYSWNIDTRLRPITVEVLRPESKLGLDD